MQRFARNPPRPILTFLEFGMLEFQCPAIFRDGVLLANAQKSTLSEPGD